jgi:chorismate lyase/3-hydroxybenzoate synthase
LSVNYSGGQDNRRGVDKERCHSAMMLQVVEDDQLTASNDLLVAFRFSRTHHIGDDPRNISVGLNPIDGASHVECWRTSGRVESGRHGKIAYAGDGRHFSGHLLLDERAGADLEAVGYHGYSAILDWLQAFGGLHLLRVWNYVPDINRMQAGLERYRSFCIGRSRALADQGLGEGALPAATGVGSEAPGLMISFLAASEPGVQIENPRQLSAFRYPAYYGPKSPSFSRALTYQTGQEGLLLISGTASIVGHETMHAGSVEDQCEETCHNLDAVIEAAGGRHELMALRLYIRHEDDAAAALNLCRRRFGDEMPIIPLTSDICRQDLLVEIEGVASLSGKTQELGCRS